LSLSGFISNEEKQLFVFLNLHQMSAPPLPDEIRAYLLAHSKSASTPDPDKSRIRIIKSDQSGNGKSLVSCLTKLFCIRHLSVVTIGEV
jgi:hypothetical protein